MKEGTVYALFDEENFADEKESNIIKKILGNRMIEVDVINMAQSSTNVRLKGFHNVFNSIYLKFFENGKEIDIYSDTRFNPYI